MLRIHWWEAWTVTSIRSASVHIWWKCQRSSGLTTKSQTTQQSRGLKRHWKKWPMTPPETAFRLKASKNGWDGLEEIGFMFGFRCKPSRLRLVNYCWSVKRHRKQLVLKLLARFLAELFFSYLKRHNTFRALEPFRSSVGRNDFLLQASIQQFGERNFLLSHPPVICTYVIIFGIYIYMTCFFCVCILHIIYINCCFLCGAV